MENTSSLPADVLAVLNQEPAYDEVAESNQALVRAAWNRRIDQAIDELDLYSEFVATEWSWTEADEHGNPVHRRG